ncbi:MAG: SDR family NAD(P)-dependent oxidoreductase [Gammaproteobacteria bacterium]
MIHNIVIIGSSGAIGSALTAILSTTYPNATIYALSRQAPQKFQKNIIYNEIDYYSETSIKNASSIAAERKPIDIIIVATGILHQKNLSPEKSLQDLSFEKFKTSFEANAVVPAMLAKHFLPKLNKHSRSIFAALSARVGSISDNRLGGWYSYRASKAALNMIVKNASIETQRSNKEAIVVALHPGTVDSPLSKPFQKNVPLNKLFTPEFSATKLISVLETLSPKDSGKCFDWSGQEVKP